jgi:hypothetical protein
MYADKDISGKISFNEMNQDEVKDLASILFEFEHLIGTYSSLPEREQARLILFSAKLRFQIIDALI